MNVLIVLIKLQLNNLFLQLKLLRWMVFGKDTFNIKLSIGITSYAQSVGKCYSNGLSVGISRVRRFLPTGSVRRYKFILTDCLSVY